MNYNQAVRRKDRLVIDLEELADEVSSVEDTERLKAVARELDAINLSWYE